MAVRVIMNNDTKRPQTKATSEVPEAKAGY